jgi:hypothetical protein
MAKPGTVPKDKLISDNFNRRKPKVSAKALAKAKRQALMLHKLDKAEKTKEELHKGKIKEVLASAEKALGVPGEELVTSGKDKDEISASQMLDHLRYAYINSKGPDGSKGRKRLVRLMEADAEFKFFIKELTKIETSLLAARIRKNENEDGTKIGQQNFFVVLKGLEDTPVIKGNDPNSALDMMQIESALNPNAQRYVVEDDRGRNEAPEMMVGRLNAEDDDEDARVSGEEV